MRLTKRQREVLYYIFRYPGMTDTRIASISGIPLATVNNCRRKFFAEGLCRFINIPNPYYINMEILYICYIESEYRDIQVCKKLLRDTDFYVYSDAKRMLILGLSRDFSNAEQRVAEIRRALFEYEGVIIKDRYFPLPLSRIENYFSIHHMLGRRGEFPTFRKVGAQSINPLELRILKHMVRSPGHSNAQIARTLCTGTANVRRCREEMRAQGIFLPYNAPNLKMLGYRYMIWYDITRSPLINTHWAEKCTQKIMEQTRHMFFIHSPDMCSLITIVTNQEEIKKEHEKLRDIFVDMKMLHAKIVPHIISIEKGVCLKNHEYTGIMERV